jgi:hypothetical protein
LNEFNPGNYTQLRGRCKSEKHDFVLCKDERSMLMEMGARLVELVEKDYRRTGTYKGAGERTTAARGMGAGPKASMP